MQVTKNTAQDGCGKKSAKMMRVKVLYFAQVRELANGKHFEEKEVAEKTSVAELVSTILMTYPDSKPLIKKGITVSINYKVANGSDLLSDGDEVALLPPVTGG